MEPYSTSVFKVFT